MERRCIELADLFSRRLGMDRRQFLRTSCGMAAGFVAMNDIYGNIFSVTESEAADPGAAKTRAAVLEG